MTNPTDDLITGQHCAVGLWENCGQDVMSTYLTGSAAKELQQCFNVCESEVNLARMNEESGSSRVTRPFPPSLWAAGGDGAAAGSSRDLYIYLTQ